MALPMHAWWILLLGSILLKQPYPIWSFSLVPTISSVESTTRRRRSSRLECCRNDTVDRNDHAHRNRRAFLCQSLLIPTVIGTGLAMEPARAGAVDVAAATAAAVEMKLFVDPQGLFVLQLPQRFFVLRRTAKGDLPDEKTGSGRRGSSILNAGDLAKAEVLAVERFPTRILLEENGIVPTGSLQTFPDLGNPATIARLITLRRDRDKPGGMSNTQIVPNSIVVSNDGLDLSFVLRTAIDVQKPELLMEQFGIRELFRITAAKASLRSRDGNLLAVFASALEQDWQGPDGEALQQAVVSFQAVDRSTEAGAS